jgi:hypothetical protein
LNPTFFSAGIFCHFILPWSEPNRFLCVQWLLTEALETGKTMYRQYARGLELANIAENPNFFLRHGQAWHRLAQGEERKRVRTGTPSISNQL